MTSKHLTISKDSDLDLLKAQIKFLKNELEIITQKTTAFEDTLRVQIINELIEVQELSSLYKQLKQAKKKKRLEQKRKGKNFKESIHIKPIGKKEVIIISLDDKQEKKRLYREAMLHVHPDKFNLNEDQEDISTEVTTKLIEIYQHGSLNELQDYHAHIFSGNTLIEFNENPNVTINDTKNDAYLLKEKASLEKEIELAKNNHLYKVLTEYKDPSTFIEEVKMYYNDRIIKLRKRTRKA
jgi:hypothetical protein